MIEKAKLAAVTVFLTAGTYFFIELIHLEMGRSFHAWKLLAAAIVSVFCVYIHWERKKQCSGSYMRLLLLGPESGRPRIAYLDYLRILATVLVLALHTVQTAWADVSEMPAAWACSMAEGICFVCNPLFVMVSGALILNGRDEPLGVFYRKRVMRVLVPLAAYYLFYSFRVHGTAIFHPAQWFALLQEFAANTNAFTPHFWLIFVILMIYISAPFLRVMVKHMDGPMMTGLAAAIFVTHAVFLWLPRLGVSFVAGTWLVGWESVFLLGYFCTTEEAEKHRRLIYGGAALSLAYMMYASAQAADFSDLLYNTAPPAMFLACACFLFFRRACGKASAKIPAAVRLLSRYSFSILLIHWFVLHLVVRQTFGVKSVPLTVVCTLAVCLAYTVYFDNVFVVCLEWFCSLILDLPGRIRRRFS